MLCDILAFKAFFKEKDVHLDIAKHRLEVNVLSAPSTEAQL